MTHTGGSYDSQKVVAMTHSRPQGGSYNSHLGFKCGSYGSQSASKRRLSTEKVVGMTHSQTQEV